MPSRAELIIELRGRGVVPPAGTPPRQPVQPPLPAVLPAPAGGGSGQTPPAQPPAQPQASPETPAAEPALQGVLDQLQAAFTDLVAVVSARPPITQPVPPARQEPPNVEPPQPQTEPPELPPAPPVVVEQPVPPTDPTFQGAIHQLNANLASLIAAVAARPPAVQPVPPARQEPERTEPPSLPREPGEATPAPPVVVEQAAALPDPELKEVLRRLDAAMTALAEAVSKPLHVQPPPQQQASKTAADVAREQMEKAEREKKQREFDQEVRRERMQMDPAFAKREGRQEFQSILQQLLPTLGFGNLLGPVQKMVIALNAQSAAQTAQAARGGAQTAQAAGAVPGATRAAAGAGQAAGAAGAAGAAKAAGAAGSGAAAAMGIVGPIVMLAQEIKAQLDKQVMDQIHMLGDFGKAIGSIDARAAGQAFNEHLIKKLPVVGQYLGELGDAISGVLDAIDQTAVRLSGLSGELAMAQAEVGVRQLERQIEQADQLGPELARFVRARDEISARIEKILAQILENNLPLINLLLEGIPRLITIGEQNWQVMGIISRSMDIAIPIYGALRNMLQFMRTASEAAQRGSQDDSLESLIENLLQGAIIPNAQPAQPGLFNPNIPGLNLDQ